MTPLNEEPSPLFGADALQALNDLLRRINFRSDVFFRGRLCDSWALDTSGTGHVNFHLVGDGQCWLHLPATVAATRLVAGDIVVFPHDAVHVIGSSPEPPEAFGVKQISTLAPMDQASAGTALLCGFVEVDRTARQLLLNALPPFLVMATGSQDSSQRIRTLVELLFAEAGCDELAAPAILDRLADALLFHVVRDLARRQLRTPGLLGAFADANLRRAVVAMSADPSRRWTVEGLAREALMSRSVFADRFDQCCGMSPIEFLTTWRMHLARRLLEQERASVLDVAERCGYESPASFSKAFKRIMGAGPGQFRKIGSTRSAR